MSSNQDNPKPPEPDNSKPAAPKTTLQQFLSPGRLVKLLFLFSAGIVVSAAAIYVLPDEDWGLVSILAWICIILSVVALTVLLYWYLQPETKPTPSKDVADIYIKIASSALFILSLVVAWKSFENTSRQTARNLELAKIALENNRAEQRSRRFTDALGRLEEDTPSKRVIGVVAFTHLDLEIDSEIDFNDKFNDKKAQTLSEEERGELQKQRQKEKDEHWQIMKALISHIRRHSLDDPAKARDPDADPEANTKADISEILQHLGRRKLTFTAGEVDRLDLSSTDLRGYFKGPIPARCRGETCNPDPECIINFAGAHFSGADLERADFRGANLQNAKFDGAKLIGAQFDCADLTGADFQSADISGAIFTRAKLGRDDQLSGAYSEGKKPLCPDSLPYNEDYLTCMKPPVVKEPVKQPPVAKEPA